MTVGTAIKVGRLIVSVASAGLTFAASMYGDISIDKKIAKEVAKHFQKGN